MIREFAESDLAEIVSLRPTVSDELSENVPSAVFLLLVREENSLILTKRSDHLPNHPGQICFPGGKQQASDSDLLATACRETFEEIGVSKHRIQLLGYMDALHSLSGFYVQPVVGCIDALQPYTLDSNEVAELFTLPLDIATDLANYRRHRVDYAGQERTYYSIDHQGHHIWGLTGIVLYRMASALEKLKR